LETVRLSLCVHSLVATNVELDWNVNYTIPKGLSCGRKIEIQNRIIAQTLKV